MSIRPFLAIRTPIVKLVAAALLCSLSAKAENGPPVWIMEMGQTWGEKKLVLLTGFGPFGEITDNPSGRIIKRLAAKIGEVCGAEAGSVDPHFLQVHFSVIEELPLDQYDRIVNIGVADGIEYLRVETQARNYYFDPETKEGGPIDPSRPEDFHLRGGPLPADITRPAADFRVELGGPNSAGTYVCNDTFYRVCWRRPGSGYFIHIPNVPPTEDPRLAAGLSQVVCRILRERRPYDGAYARTR